MGLEMADDAPTDDDDTDEEPLRETRPTETTNPTTRSL